MLANGAIDEVEAQSSRLEPGAALGQGNRSAPNLRRTCAENLTLDQARDRAIISTRQYAKRQRTWFRARMKDWQTLPLPATD